MRGFLRAFYELCKLEWWSEQHRGRVEHEGEHRN